MQLITTRDSSNMTKLKFKIIDKCFQDAKNYNDDGIDFYLEESDWNDYNYTTTYCLHASKKIMKASKNEFLGNIRIMKKGQTTEDRYLLRKLFQKNNLTFTQLPKDFVTLTFSIEIFQALNRILEQDQREIFIKSLHLILGSNSPYYKDLEDDICFRNSLLRDSSSLESYELKKGKSLLENVACIYNLREQNLTVKLSHIQNSISLDFSCVSNVDSSLLPNGISVFIGKNGSGKSTAIYKLAKLLYTNPTERFRLKTNVGELDINNIGVNKLFLVTYSPFDNFIMPGITKSDYQLMFSKEKVSDQRFVFCGIRDLKAEYVKSEESLSTLDDKSDYIGMDRQNQTILKTIEQISSEFFDALKIIFTDHSASRYNLWTRMCNRSIKFHPELYSDLSDFMSLNDESRSCYMELFQSFSTGHKFFLHTMANLIAYIDENSLVLFDEPENHLHPPLLSFMMSELRILLSRKKSVMLIATHSPVILQETFAKNIYIVRKDQDNVTIKKPRIETYGENISSIMTEVFDLTTDVTKFYSVFDDLYDDWNMSREQQIDSMLAKFESKIGHKLSNQMLSYLINLHTKQ